MKKQILILIIAIAAVFTGCSQVPQGLTYAIDLQEIITDKYDSDEVAVTIDKNVLTISLIDDKFSGYSDLEKQEISKEIEAIASNLDDKPQLSGGVVKFITKGMDGMVKTSKSDSRQLILEK